MIKTAVARNDTVLIMKDLGGIREDLIETNDPLISDRLYDGGLPVCLDYSNAKDGGREVPPDWQSVIKALARELSKETLEA